MPNKPDLLTVLWQLIDAGYSADEIADAAEMIGAEIAQKEDESDAS